MKNPLASIPEPHPNPRRDLPPPRIPRQFHGRVIEQLSGGFSYEESARRYGMWTCRALVEVSFFEQKFQPGDLFRLPGNVALTGAQFRDIEFVDDRLDREDAAAAEAARLAAPFPASKNPAFAKQ